MEDCRITEFVTKYKRHGKEGRDSQAKMERSAGDITGFLSSFVKKKMRSYFLVIVSL
jgi:hypothetical protein